MTVKITTKEIKPAFAYSAIPDKTAISIAKTVEILGSMLKLPYPLAFETSKMYMLFDIAHTMANATARAPGIAAISSPRYRYDIRHTPLVTRIHFHSVFLNHFSCCDAVSRSFSPALSDTKRINVTVMPFMINTTIIPVSHTKYANLPYSSGPSARAVITLDANPAANAT